MTSGSLRFDSLMTICYAWLITGLYLDGWAHAHRRIETFFTPWHLVLYSGFFVAAGCLGLLCLRNRLGGCGWRDTVPHGYGYSLLGATIFSVGGLADVVWHQLFGFERGVEALVSPSHLVLALGVALLLSGPLRAALARPPQHRLLTQLPMILSWSFLLALLQFFTQYAHPFANAWTVVEQGQREPHRELSVIPTDGNAELKTIRQHDQDLTHPQWSPDGRFIAFVAGTLRDPKTFEIYVMHSDGTERHRLTDNEVYDGHPSWSPDGRQLVFESHRHGAESIYLMNADGTTPTRVSQDSAREADPSFSPDGQHLLFDSDRDGTWQIYTTASDGSDRRKLTERGRNRSAAWSPDGTRIAFSSDRDGSTQIHVMNVDGQGHSRLTSTDSRDDWPSWSPDGRTVAFVAQTSSDFEVYTVGHDGSGLRNITRDPGREDSDGAPVSWSPDGKRLLVGTLGHALSTASLRQAFGLTAILLQTVVLMGFVLLAVLRWHFAKGGIFILVTLNLALACTQGRDMHLPLLLAALGTGFASEYLRWLLRPDLRNPTGLRRYAFYLPCICFAWYFLLLGNTTGLAWSLPFWSGTLVLAGTAGWLLSFLFVAENVSL
jgi:hypothetical protein